VHCNKRVMVMHKTEIQNILNGKTPAAQLNFRKARGFANHCLSIIMIRVDVLAGAKLSKMKKVGHYPWGSSESDHAEAHHLVGILGSPYEFLLQAGQSKCEVVRIVRRYVYKGMMTMKRQKTGTT
jgi:hypothetical protein